MPGTIVALSTPPGVSGIAVIRISGDDAFTIVDKVFSGKTKLSPAQSHTIHYGTIYDNETPVDTVLASVFHSPNSYTSEDTVEISCHGGYAITGEIIRVLIANGAVAAEAGEFTKRAFLNGKLDLTQAEAVADIIHSESTAGALTAVRQLLGGFKRRLSELRSQLADIAALLELELDFADEDIEITNKSLIIKKIMEAETYCRLLSESYHSAEVLRNGYYIGLAGYPNSGKSTLFNSLLGKIRAIVSPKPGTTRDYIEDSLIIGGIVVRLIDTAGIRNSEDEIEVEGIKLAHSALKQCNMILIVNDCYSDIRQSDMLLMNIKDINPDTKVILLQNKIDKFEGTFESIVPDEIYISAKTGLGLDLLKEQIKTEAESSSVRINDVLVNQRQARLLGNAADLLHTAGDALNQGVENELVSLDIRNAVDSLGEISGERFSEEVLNNIFGRFCIGK
ncbi:MAG: tRNA modification GTPase MnmE [Ignavibacteria bacterium]|nr:tRNA modification GTPase MnmE [Ignavibacteria bacterium]